MNNILSPNNTRISYYPITANPVLNPNRPIKISTPGIDIIQKIGEVSDPKVVPTKMLLSLLNSGLNGTKTDKKVFVGRSYNDWVNMYNMAIENAITPTVLDGINNNPEIKVPEDVKANMEINKDFAKKYHGYQERVLKDFTEITSANGVDTVQMKGIGFSMNYPNPTSRFGGDIDIFNFKHGTDPSNPKNNMSFFIDDLVKENGINVDNKHCVKHSNFEFKKVPIENHRNFLNKEIAPIADKMNKYLFKVLKPVEETLPHGTKILVPSKEFNTVFLSFHAMQHFVGAGINFHHLADWAVHIKKHGLKVPEEAKGTKFEQFMYAFTNLANKHLGTNVEVPENKKLEDEIFKRMVHSENKMGIDIKPPKIKDPISMLIFKFKKIKVTNSRKNEFYEIKNSVAKSCFKSLIQHIKNPKTFIDLFTKVK